MNDFKDMVFAGHSRADVCTNLWRLWQHALELQKLQRDKTQDWKRRENPNKYSFPNLFCFNPRSCTYLNNSTVFMENSCQVRSGRERGMNLSGKTVGIQECWQGCVSESLVLTVLRVGTRKKKTRKASH